MNEATTRLLDAALQFAASLAANGASVDVEHHNLLTFTVLAQTSALHGQPEQMLDHAQRLQASLDALTAPVEASTPSETLYPSESLSPNE